MEINENLNAPVEEKPKVSQYFVKSDNGIIEINENIKPTEIVDYLRLYHANKEVENSFPYLIPSKRGKWMMFIENNVDFDQKWKDCCKLYDQGKLIGIRYLTCSTGYKDDHPAYKNSNVILFNCGPASDRTKMLEFGLNLLKYIPYCSQSGYIAYKSREQTKKTNTPADNSNNFLYRIPVPRDESSNGKVKINRFFVRSENLEELSNFIEVNEEIKPSEISDYLYLYHQNMNILNLFPDLGPNSRGTWNMFCKDVEDFDNKWKDCCKLYQDGKLIGIRSLKCTTGHNKNPFRSGHEIFFCCGPASDKSKMLEYGKNLLTFIPYCSDSGYMTYKSREQTEKGMQASNNRVFYRIPVPKHLTF